MNNTRALGRLVLVPAVAAALLLVTGVSGAWAGPAPLEPEPGRGGAGLTGGSSSGSDGASAWEIATVGLMSAALAIVLTLLVTYAVTHRRSARPAPA